MKLAIEVVRTTADGQTLSGSFEVGKKITELDFARLFSESEQEDFRRMGGFSITSSFDEEAVEIRLHNKGSEILLNDELVDKAGKIFLIHKYNNLKIKGEKFGCQLIVGGPRRKYSDK